MSNKLNIVVIGSGAWGSALAKHCDRLGHNVSLYCRRKEIADEINKTGNNKTYLDGIDLSNISATNDINITKSADIVLVVTPSQHMRDILSNVIISDNTPVLLCCKGIENSTGKLMTEVANDCIKNAQIMVLSGPTFAIEVAKNLPTGVSLAGDNTTFVKDSLFSPHFRVYETNDIIGAEIYGAVKNVLAIACGITRGRNMGDNALSALITRGVAETTKLSIALGGKSETALSLCAIGDIMLTCSSIQSRNMSFGYELGQGKSANEILENRASVTEGVENCKSVFNLAKKHNVEMPICESIYKIIHNNENIDEVIEKLLNR